MTSNNPVAEALQPVLANSYLLYLKTQNYHWNVTGPRFSSLHTLFETQYSALALAVDEIAERIRALGAKANASVKSYTSQSVIEDGDENSTAETMVRQLRDDQHALVSVMKKALKVAQEHNDEASADLLIGRITDHEKAAWMLDASL